MVYDDSGQCILFDPGCSDRKEREVLTDFLSQNQLQPVRLINTHCHLDHILGNAFVHEQFGLPLEAHRGEQVVLQFGEQMSKAYGIPYDLSPDIERFIEDKESLTFGQTRFEALYTPGHSPASLSFFFPDDSFLIAGDVLFYNSIGRTDLPGGDYDTLIGSIKDRLFPLGDEVKVYPGHGTATSIGYERLTNPFLTGK